MLNACALRRKSPRPITVDDMDELSNRNFQGGTNVSGASASAGYRPRALPPMRVLFDRQLQRTRPTKPTPRCAMRSPSNLAAKLRSSWLSAFPRCFMPTKSLCSTRGALWVAAMQR